MSDTVSRQGVLKILTDISYNHCPTAQASEAVDLAKTMVAVMPDAEPEIIHCRYCKYSEHWYADKCRCFLWHGVGIDVFEDGFCSYAEMRTDEKAD